MSNTELNGYNNIKEWNKLTVEEKKGLENAIAEIDTDKTISNEKVIKKFRKEYSDLELTLNEQIKNG